MNLIFLACLCSEDSRPCCLLQEQKPAIWEPRTAQRLHLSFLNLMRPRKKCRWLSLYNKEGTQKIIIIILLESNHLPDLFLMRRNNMNYWYWQLSLSSSSSIKQLHPKIQTCWEDKSFHKFGFVGCSVLSQTFVCAVSILFSFPLFL